jgi:membrane protein involved in colicin uptake
MTTVVRRDIARRTNRLAERAKAAARRKHLAALAARAAQQAAAKAAAAKAAAAKAAAPTTAPPSSGADAADSPLGVCVRDAEEGGSYAWGPGNGGGAYQFEIGTWEKYGGAADEYGVAGPAYQDQIFDNAVAAGGASNWTAYDGC